MIQQKPQTKILVDGGDPSETLRIKNLIGFVDGQTTNPSLIAHNPEIMDLVKSGHKLSKAEQDTEYKKIVQSISTLVGDCGVSIEVFADIDTKAEAMFAEGKDKFTWIPNAYIKYPCTHEGLKAAEMSVAAGMRVNITLVFTQSQAAAVYAATKNSKEPVYISPFVGRLDDKGQNGMSLIKNIKEMLKVGDGHVKVLVASIRSIEHLMYCFALQADLATVPTKILEAWASKGFEIPKYSYIYDAKGLNEIPYQNLDLEKSWQNFDISHELTTKGIEKFV